MRRGGLLAAILVLCSTSAALAQQQGTRAHVLQGAWTVRRLDQGSAARLQIDQVFSSRGVTNVTGQLVLAPGAACPLTGSVIDDLRAQYSDEPEVRSFPISAFVTFRARCGEREYWIEALGLPSGTVLMNGRMTEIGAAGRGVAPISIGR